MLTWGDSCCVVGIHSIVIHLLLIRFVQLHSSIDDDAFREKLFILFLWWYSGRYSVHLLGSIQWCSISWWRLMMIHWCLYIYSDCSDLHWYSRWHSGNLFWPYSWWYCIVVIHCWSIVMTDLTCSCRWWLFRWGKYCDRYSVIIAILWPHGDPICCCWWCVNGTCDLLEALCWEALLFLFSVMTCGDGSILVEYTTWGCSDILCCVCDACCCIDIPTLHLNYYYIVGKFVDLTYYHTHCSPFTTTFVLPLAHLPFLITICRYDFYIPSVFICAYHFNFTIPFTFLTFTFTDLWRILLPIHTTLHSCRPLREVLFDRALPVGRPDACLFTSDCSYAMLLEAPLGGMVTWELHGGVGALLHFCSLFCHSCSLLVPFYLFICCGAGSIGGCWRYSIRLMRYSVFGIRWRWYLILWLEAFLFLTVLYSRCSTGIYIVPFGTSVLRYWHLSIYSWNRWKVFYCSAFILIRFVILFCWWLLQVTLFLLTMPLLTIYDCAILMEGIDLHLLFGIPVSDWKPWPIDDDLF